VVFFWQALNCYLDYLLSEAKTLTEKQMTMLLWEVIIETADTTLVTVEWAMYQLAKNPECQVVNHLLPKYICRVVLVYFSLS